MTTCDAQSFGVAVQASVCGPLRFGLKKHDDHYLDMPGSRNGAGRGRALENTALTNESVYRATWKGKYCPSRRRESGTVVASGDSTSLGASYSRWRLRPLMSARRRI